MDLSQIITAIGIGLLATTSPCVFPLYPGYLAYLSANQGRAQDEKSRTRTVFLGFFVLLGVLVMMLIMGFAISLLSLSISRVLSVVVPLVDLILIVLGVMLILNINPFKQLPQIHVPALAHPFANAFLYGLLYGPIAFPCSGPLVISIFALSLKSTLLLARVATFFWFGLGFGLPLLVLSLLGGALQRPITIFFARHSRWVNLVSGLLILGLGIYDLIINWASISAAYF
ncbi:cytochrome c biogenesis CcdA family protein [Pelolinea submarina]|uniref:Cytochrome c-type biogenesis protein n=1 Tax=Pelolinea submarina TaxID=913107 RepID=A0A347ZVW7_9CHLR|nr:cytochrome c biogenesis protein CcdA [Pelolinea submarina]REG07144.1 cytochrome c-type biogenesis protein [Pelolinea submarina]BBB49448.1 cytochrome c-type biogenesis protein [Pelolinea submarina]